MTNTITLAEADANALTELAAAYPGITPHLAHLAVFRMGLRVATADPTLLAGELAAINEERCERRRHARLAKNDGAGTAQGGSNG